MALVSAGTILVLVVTFIGAAGALVQVGRRIGRSEVEQEETQTDVEELNRKIDDQFAELQEQLSTQQYRRIKREEVIIEWLETLHDALSTEVDTDVEKPDEVTKDIGIDTPDTVADEDVSD